LGRTRSRAGQTPRTTPVVRQPRVTNDIDASAARLNDAIGKFFPTVKTHMTGPRQKTAGTARILRSRPDFARPHDRTRRANDGVARAEWPFAATNSGARRANARIPRANVRFAHPVSASPGANARFGHASRSIAPPNKRLAHPPHPFAHAVSGFRPRARTASPAGAGGSPP